jgi:D-lactate dehydrogenase
MNKKILVAFFDAKPYDIHSFKELSDRSDFLFTFFDVHLKEETADLAKGFDAVCAFVNDTINRQVINKLADYGIELIALRCAGYNNVDLEAAYGRIHITRVPAYSPYAVAEHAMALILSLNRKIHRSYNRTREGNFSINGLLGFDIHGKTAGVIGTGKIGRVMIQILKGFQAEILAYDPFPDEVFAKNNNIQYTTLDTIYQQSDIITLHCPLTPETTGIINKKSLSLMKPDVYIINTSRGPLIKTRDLIESLKSRKIGGAGLDVYEEESELFFEDNSNCILDDDVLARLLTFNNVIITSHQAFFTKEALSNIAETTLNNITDFFNRDLIPNEVCYHCSDNCHKKIVGKCF